MAFFDYEDALDFVPKQHRRKGEFTCPSCKEMVLTEAQFKNGDDCHNCSDDGMDFEEDE